MCIRDRTNRIAISVVGSTAAIDVFQNKRNSKIAGVSPTVEFIRSAYGRQIPMCNKEENKHYTNEYNYVRAQSVIQKAVL